jgi:hypothetical protein
MKLFVLFILLTNIINAQDFYTIDNDYLRKKAEIDSLKNSKNLLWTCIKYNELLSSKYNYLPTDLFHAAQQNAIFGNYQKTYLLLEKLSEDKNYVSFFDIENAVAFSKINNEKRFLEITAKVKSNWQQYIDTFSHSEIAKELVKLYAQDQITRNNLMFLSTILDSVPNESLLMKEMKINDSLNLISILNILDKFAWLSKKEVGFVNTVYFQIFQHASFVTQKKYFNLIENAYKEEKMESYEYALFIDRFLIGSGKKQKYGSQLKMYKNKWVVFPIENPHQINIIRTQMSMEPIENYLKTMGIEWSLDEYIKIEKELCKFFNISP